MINSHIDKIYIGYGSESGNAQTLAYELYSQDFIKEFNPKIVELNDIALETISINDLLIIISSSFGDGDPPSNGDMFLNQIKDANNITSIKYAIFGLGDISYPTFCGYTKNVDDLLKKKGAQSLINRVDSDIDFSLFFSKWIKVLKEVLNGNLEAGINLKLQVIAYGEKNSFKSKIINRNKLNKSIPCAWNIRLDIKNSGIFYKAGDNLYVIPKNNDEILNKLQSWFKSGDIEILRDKELKIISKSFLRSFVKITNNAQLKSLLKISQKSILNSYLERADLLDVLQDFANPNSISLDEINQLLSPCLPRAYSIASCYNSEYVDLCIREVQYEFKDRLRKGITTSYLIDEKNLDIDIYVRSNPNLYLPEDKKLPIVMIATGTGIAPMIGLLEEMKSTKNNRETVLIFGDKNRNFDFLYEEKILSFKKNDTLTNIITAFSRDGEKKYYVQDAILDNILTLEKLLNNNAHIYICGNKNNLQYSISEIFNNSLMNMVKYDNNDKYWDVLIKEKRLHLELY